MGTATKTIRYEYDTVGNRKLMVDPDGGRFTYAYDSLNRISHLENPQAERTTFAYDVNGRRTLKLLANGTRASFIYDDADNLITLGNLKSDGSIISRFDYQYDRSGNRNAVLEADGSHVTWSYDDTYQLTGEHRTGTVPYRNTFTYDPAGNRTLKNEDGQRTTYAYDAANQLTTSQSTAGTTMYVFDADGNLQLVVEPIGDRTTYGWDSENQNTRVEQPGGEIVTATYNGELRRIAKHVTASETIFSWDVVSDSYLAEFDDFGSTQAVYTVEPVMFGNVLSQRRGNGTAYYHFDALGSTRQLTDAAEAVTDALRYRAFGTELSRTGTTVLPFRFVGRIGYYHDQATGLIYVRARHYDPEIARWMSRDPVSFLGGINLYSYVRPTVLTDPSGLDAKDCIEAVGVSLACIIASCGFLTATAVVLCCGAGAASTPVTTIGGALLCASCIVGSSFCCGACAWAADDIEDAC